MERSCDIPRQNDPTELDGRVPIRSIEDCVERLRQWVETSGDGVRMVFEAPSSETIEPCISLYPCGLQDLLYRHGTTRHRPPLGFRIRYLVTVWANRPSEALETLTELIFSAMDEAEFEVELPAADWHLWQTFGLLPRPSFFLVVSIRRAREEPTLPQVKEPPRVQSSPASPLVGRVLRTDHRPVANARVTVDGLGLAATSDARGHFGFPALPLGDGRRVLEVTVDGVSKTVVVDTLENQGEPVLVFVEPS